MKVMDEEEKEALVKMLVKNSLQNRMSENITGNNEEESRDISTPERDQLTSLKYNYAMQRLIDDYFNYDLMEVTASDLQQSIMIKLIDLADVQQTIEDSGLVEKFSAEMGNIKQEWGKTPSYEYTIWFPWHVRWDDDRPTFKIYGHTFEPAEESDWRPRLEEIARGPNVRDGGTLLNEIEEGDYDVWRTTITSRTPRWAMVRFKNALEILSAQLNHSAYFIEYQTRGDRLGRMSGEVGDAGRWTAIQRPFGVFYVDENVDEHPYTPHWGANVYHRGGRPDVSLDYSSFSNRFDRHPTFEDFRVGQEPLLHNVLVEYQQGLTETDHRRSFINFWRIIEELSLVGRGQKKQVTVERALSALELVTDGDYDPIFERVANEIWEVRNDRTHNTGWIHIGTEHEIVTKVLADAMIELYLTEFVDSDGEINKSNTRRVLKWATKPEETQEALKTVNRLLGE